MTAHRSKLTAAADGPHAHPRPGEGRDPETGRFTKGHTFSLKWTEEKSVQLAKDLVDWMVKDQRNFWLEDFLIERGLYPDMIATLSERYEPFADYIARAKAIQASRIKKFALTNNINPGMAQWVLNVHHGERNVEKRETEVKSNQPIIIQLDSEDVRG